MLNIYYGNMKESVYNTAAYFNMTMKIAGLLIQLKELFINLSPFSKGKEG